VTVTKTYRNRTPTPQDVSASVTKVWVVDGVAVTPPAYTSSFDVTLDGEMRAIDAGEMATFGDLADGDTYDLTVTDVSALPDAEVIEEPDEVDETPDPPEPVEVKEETLVAELPKTGTAALLLTTLGLSGVGIGGRLLGRGRHG